MSRLISSGANLQTPLKTLQDYLQTGAQGLGSVFSAVSSTFLTLFTGPIIAFFPFKRQRKVLSLCKGIIPQLFVLILMNIAKLPTFKLAII